MTSVRHQIDQATNSDEIAGSISMGDYLGIEPEFSPDAIPVLSESVVNVASVPQRSPLRYPGGKTWLVPQIRKWLAGLETRPELFLEPFAGGGIASLTAVMDGLVDRAAMCEIDPDIARLWRCIIDHSEKLAQEVEVFEATGENVQAILSRTDGDEVNAAFKTLLRNRISRGGILAKGASIMKQGENGSGVASRWYPRTLAARIRAIGSYADRIDFIHGDGMSLIDLSKDSPTTAFFIDPPYTAAGKRAGRRLYDHNEIDHEDLFESMSTVKGSFMMTYDESEEIIRMARARGFSLAKVPMKNTHHDLLYELLITSSELSA